jgi:protein-tyrosine phosphatase
MATPLVKLEPDHVTAGDLGNTPQILRDGGLVAAPTETVYGILARRDSDRAIERLLTVRGSAPTKHLSIHIADPSDAEQYVEGDLAPGVRRLMETFWPGPLTVVVNGVGGESVGLRCPNHPVTRTLIREAGVPLVMPSANRSGEEPAASADQVLTYFPEGLDAIIDGGPAHHGVSSTVVRTTSGVIEILREGAIPGTMIFETAATGILFVCTGNTCRSPMAEGIARMKLAERFNCAPDQLALRAFRVASAGVFAARKSPAASESAAVVGEYGGDLGAHESQPLSRELLAQHDFIYAMTAGHLASIQDTFPDLADRVQLLDPAGGEIPDPIGAGIDVYRATGNRIAELIDQRLSDWVPE